jgi:hypothetical protein
MDIIICMIDVPPGREAVFMIQKVKEVMCLVGTRRACCEPKSDASPE